MSANKPTATDLSYLGFKKDIACYYQTSPEHLTQYSLKNEAGVLTAMHVLAIDTGEFTGRSPKDRFIVRDEVTENQVLWNDINLPFTIEAFNRLYYQITNYLSTKVFFVRDAFACADKEHQLGLRIISETAYQSLFAHNLFLHGEANPNNQPEWTIIAAPGFKADASEHHTRQHNFSIINFTKKIILIGGTGYTGEIKKAVFSVLNFLLPQKGILPMHCAANVGSNMETAIFFGLSGTGKTTLSADPERRLIGDDEHGWSKNGIFNFEGGCYAKTVNLNSEKEPQIYAALKPGALLENICFYPGSNEVDFENISITENTRVSYPIDFIPKAVVPSIGGIPRNIFFLTADAFGVLPAVSKLDAEQAFYYFISGYTAKVAGTEYGVNEPSATFSACFGKAFIPLNPLVYADLLAEKIKQNAVNVWLINTGWIGGSYGTGERIKLCYTRAIIKAAINGQLTHVAYKRLPVFGLMMPEHCPDVPDMILDPAENWANFSDYQAALIQLHKRFEDNFAQYKYVNA